MERVLMFLPSILIIGSIAGATSVYIKRVTEPRFGDDIKSVNWKQNKWKDWLLIQPILIIWAPTAEELLFRAPLIIAFDAMSPFAWYGIFISSALFSLVHWLEREKRDIRKKILNVVSTFLLSILAGYFGIKYQSIWLSVGIHAMCNLIPTMFFLLIVVIGLSSNAITSLQNKVRCSKC